MSTSGRFAITLFALAAVACNDGRDIVQDTGVDATDEVGPREVVDDVPETDAERGDAIAETTEGLEDGGGDPDIDGRGDSDSGEDGTDAQPGDTDSEDAGDDADGADGEEVENGEDVADTSADGADGDDTADDTTPIDASDSDTPPVDPCTGIVCGTPPPATCEGDQRVSFGSGTCHDGACDYARTSSACPFGCAAGTCLPDPCAGVVCDEPPAATCTSANARTVFATTGTCAAGMCSYPSTVVACEFGCVAGACDGDPCGGISCDVPPPDRCADAANLWVYEAVGACVEGACLYDRGVRACPFGCAADACLPDPCAGVVCDDPPDACHAAVGTCDDGECAYALRTGACDDGNACTVADACDAGGTCVGVDRTCDAPPSPVCVGDARRTFAPTGLCVRGACPPDATCQDGCAYAATDTPCAFGCAAAACLPDPCLGVSCTTPPQDSCVDGTTLLHWTGPGVCADGDCAFDSETFECPLGCVGGRCALASCDGIACVSPPTRTCVGDVARSYDLPGACGGGVCDYAPIDVPCSDGCIDGRCVAPAHVVISEVVVDVPGFPDNDAFVELHGPAGLALGGWRLVAYDQAGVSYAEAALSGSLPAWGTVSIGASWWPDLIVPDFDLEPGPGSLRLYQGTVQVDAVAWGRFDGGVPRGEGTPTVEPPTGLSIARDEFWNDHDDNVRDFEVGEPTPGEPNQLVNAEPTITLTCPTHATVGEGFEVIATGADGDGEILGYEVDLGDGDPPFGRLDGVIGIAYATPGIRKLRVTAVDDGGARATAECRVAILDVGWVQFDGDLDQCWHRFHFQDVPFSLSDVELEIRRPTSTATCNPNFKLQYKTTTQPIGTWSAATVDPAWPGIRRLTIAKGSFNAAVDDIDRFEVLIEDLCEPCVDLTVRYRAKPRLPLDITVVGGGAVKVTPLVYTCESCYPPALFEPTHPQICDGEGECRFAYDEGREVEIAVWPDPDAVFVGWSGDCGGSAYTSHLTIEGARHCAATFVPSGFSTGTTRLCVWPEQDSGWAAWEDLPAAQGDVAVRARLVESFQGCESAWFELHGEVYGGPTEQRSLACAPGAAGGETRFMLARDDFEVMRSQGLFADLGPLFAASGSLRTRVCFDLDLGYAIGSGASCPVGTTWAGTGCVPPSAGSTHWAESPTSWPAAFGSAYRWISAPLPRAVGDVTLSIAWSSPCETLLTVLELTCDGPNGPYTWDIELPKSHAYGCATSNQGVQIPCAIFNEAIEHDGRLRWRLDDRDCAGSCGSYTRLDRFELDYEHE